VADWLRLNKDGLTYRIAIDVVEERHGLVQLKSRCLLVVASVFCSVSLPAECPRKLVRFLV
jgi:hypothetical protein